MMSGPAGAQISRLKGFFKASYDKLAGLTEPENQSSAADSLRGECADTDLDRLVDECYWHHQLNYADAEFIDDHLGYALNRRPNDVSRHMSALHSYLTARARLNDAPLDRQAQIAVLQAMAARFHDNPSHRVPLILLAKLRLAEGKVWETFRVIEQALEFDAYCELSISVLLEVLRKLPASEAWANFFARSISPSISDLKRGGAETQTQDYLIEFCRALRACDALELDANAHAVRMFFHRWWVVYRHSDSRIGIFRAYGNSDQSRPIAALRHVLETAARRHVWEATGTDDEDAIRRRVGELCANLERAAPDRPVLLLWAECLGDGGQLEDALAKAERAYNLDTRDLVTQHVLDCIEHALARKAKQLPYEFSLLAETPRRFPGKFCNVPFDEAYINPDGDTFLCCAAMLPVPVGNIFKQKNWDEVWNSSTAQELRASILDGTFKYCNKRSCPTILNDDFIREERLSEQHETLQDRWRAIIADHRVHVDEPMFADLGYDASCNLSCPQCRLDLFILNKKGFAALDAARVNVVDNLLAQLRVVRISSGGEALFSRHFRKVLADINPTACPNLTHLELVTNGTLFNERQWNTFKNLHYLNTRLTFSIDAGSKETFESIRRLGRWEKMVENLEFASRLRREGRITKFQLSFVVQAENFREMPALVRLAEGLGVDDVYFFQLENIGTYSMEDFQGRSVVDPGHPQHQEFLEVVRDPALGSPVVAAHNLSPFIIPVHGPRPGRPVRAHDPFWGELQF